MSHPTCELSSRDAQFWKTGEISHLQVYFCCSRYRMNAALDLIHVTSKHENKPMRTGSSNQLIRCWRHGAGVLVEGANSWKEKDTGSLCLHLCPCLLCQLLLSWTLIHQMLCMDILVSEAGKSPPIRIIWWYYIHFARVNFKQLLQVKVFYVTSPSKKQCQEHLRTKTSEKKTKKFRKLFRSHFNVFFFFLNNSSTEGMYQTVTGVS